MSADPAVSGERTVANVAQVKSRAIRLQRRLALACVALLGAGLLVWYYVHLASASTAAGASTRRTGRETISSEMRLPALGPRVADAARPKEVATTGLSAERTGPMAAQTRDVPPTDRTEKSAGDGTPVAQTRAASATSSPVLLHAGSEASAATPTSSATPDEARIEELRRLAAAPERIAASAATASLADALVPTVTTPAEAAIVPTRRWLLPKGSFLDCTLETAIDSTLPGMTTCVLAVDAFGADGRVVLLERGTKLVGETRSEVRAGQARVAVLWSEARTPTGVVVALSSPGTDALGRAGVPGAVDNHIAARFGAAVLLSIIDGAISGFVAHEQGSAGVIYNPQGTREVATDALRNTIGIPPTITVPAGARIQVLVARDVDFRSVYRLASRVDR